MPVYAYRCKICGVQFERVQRFSDDPVSVCPECAEATVTRIIHPAGIIFKGSGWYVKDSKGSNSAGKPGKKETVSEGDGTAEKTSASDAGAEKSNNTGSQNSNSKEASGTGTGNSKKE